MSQLDLIAHLRETRPAAPFELRERVRQIAARAPTPRRRVTWRRAFVVLVPVAAAAALATVFLPRGGNPTSTEMPPSDVLRTLTPSQNRSGQEFSLGGAADAAAPTAKAATGSIPRLSAAAPPASSKRAQDYSATLTLRLPTANAVSKATTRALQITASLGGYPQIVRVNASGKDGTAYLVVRVPTNRVQDAVRRLGALGTIVGENVTIQDLQAGVDTTSRTIARLKQQLATLHAQPETDELKRQIAALTTRIDRLQRARAATLRSAQFATVKLQLATPPAAVPSEDEDGPLDGLVVAFTWIGIGAVYALALGTPLALLVALGWFLGRGFRRRREERLLSRA